MGATGRISFFSWWCGSAWSCRLEICLRRRGFWTWRCWCFWGWLPFACSPKTDTVARRKTRFIWGFSPRSKGGSSFAKTAFVIVKRTFIASVRNAKTFCAYQGSRARIRYAVRAAQIGLEQRFETLKNWKYTIFRKKGKRSWQSSAFVVKYTSPQTRKWRNWQTRTFEGRVDFTVRVQVPFSAPK